jgi:hypothetical protein
MLFGNHRAGLSCRRGSIVQNIKGSVAFERYLLFSWEISRDPGRSLSGQDGGMRNHGARPAPFIDAFGFPSIPIQIHWHIPLHFSIPLSAGRQAISPWMQWSVVDPMITLCMFSWSYRVVRFCGDAFSHAPIYLSVALPIDS